MMDSVNQPAREARRGAQILSTILFLAAIGFAAAGIYIYYFNDEDQPPERSIPTTTPGLIELADVVQAFKQAGFDADYGRSPPTADSNQIDTPTPGQHVLVEGQSVFIFAFSGADPASARVARETAATDLDPATMTLATRGGQAIGDGETLRIFQGSNVIAVLVGGDDDLAADVQGVIESLP